jgi:hypothetical protein
MIAFTALIFILQFVDSLVSANLELDEARNFAGGAKVLQPWTQAQPPDGSFSVMMPQPTLLLTNLIQGPSGPLSSVQLGSTDYVAQATYIAAYTPFPYGADLSDKEEIFKTAHTRFTPVGELQRDKPLILQGYPGRETEIELRNGSNTMIMRAFIVGQRLYQVTALVPRSRGPTTNVWRFLDSLQVSTNSLPGE